MRPKVFDLILAIVTATLNIVLALLLKQPTLIGIIFVLPLVFLLPGYTLTEALFQKRSEGTSGTTEASNTIQGGTLSGSRPELTRLWELTSIERLIFSIGLSLVIDVVGGFLLNQLPIGLSITSWAELLGIVTITFALLGLLQRMKQRKQLRNRRGMQPQRLRLHVSITQYFLLVLAVTVIGISVLYSINSAQQQPSLGFTQLWMHPPTDNVKSCTVLLGVQNFEASPMTYRIDMTMDKHVVKTWSSIVLAPQQKWEQIVPITINVTKRTATNVNVGAQLYRLDRSKVVYRKVYLTLHASGKLTDGKGLACAVS